MVKAVAAISHHPAGLGHAAQLLGQFQQTNLCLDDLSLGRCHRGFSREPAGALRYTYGSATRPLSPSIQTVRQLTS